MVKSKLPSKRFWNNKKVFITGHTSFKGSWLKLWLNELGSKTYGFSNSYPSYPKCLYKYLYKREELDKSENILNYQKLFNKLNTTNPEIVFHLAADSILSDSFKNPLKTYKTNILGTANLIEACSKIESIKIVMIVTSDKCYDEDQKEKFYSEKSILGGSEPYSASKASAELLAKSYAKKFKMINKKIITLRAGNVIGGGDWKKNRLIPDIYKFIFEKKKIFYRDLFSVRPWQHVLDCINGYLLATEYAHKNKDIFYDKWNFSPKLQYQKKVKWFIDSIFFRHKITKILEKDKLKFYENKRLILNSNKANRKLGWEAIIVGEKLIGLVDNWYTKFYMGSDAREISLNQIKFYYKLNKSL